MDWNILVAQWEAMLTAITGLEGESSDLVIDPPATEDEVREIESELGADLPGSLREVFLTRSRCVSFSWYLPRHFNLPAAIRNTRGGGMDLSLDKVAEAEWGRRRWIENVLSTREDPILKGGWDGVLAFHDTAIGDYLAIDLRTPGRQQVVMLSHDEDRVMDAVLGKDLQEFLVDWSAIGCIGPEPFVLAPFLHGGARPLDPEGANARLWRATIGWGS